MSAMAPSMTSTVARQLAGSISPNDIVERGTSARKIGLPLNASCPH